MKNLVKSIKVVGFATAHSPQKASYVETNTNFQVSYLQFKYWCFLGENHGNDRVSFTEKRQDNNKAGD